MCAVPSHWLIRAQFLFSAGAWFLITALPLSGEPAKLLPEMVVLSERGVADGAPLAEWSREDLREAAPRTVDELMAQEPAFSLYRRQSSLFGNPTSAGVSLRNTGATAASRTLVLLDGVPQNDPFGGWVYWARYDAAALDFIRIVPSARAAVWGNQSPAGVIQMNGRAPFEDLHVVKAGAGGQATYSGSTLHQLTNQERTFSAQVAAFGLQSDGFFAVGSDQRGPIDRKLDLDLWGTDAKFAWLAAPGLTLEPSVSYYTEERGNGTPLAKNATDALDFSLRLTSEHEQSSWQAIAWHQRREFESTFSSVNAPRTAETLALNQFDVPGRGSGAAVTVEWERGAAWSFLAGADTRLLNGETNEDVGTFRRRVAGGEQDFFGIFGTAAYQFDEKTQISGSARLDGWWLSDAQRVEKSLSSGATLRDEHPEDRDGIEPSASLEYTRQVRADLEARVSAGSSFRMPTLNELYRPFRVRNDIVEANPQLDPERFLSVEAGLEWNPTQELRLNAASFFHRISDAVANVPVTNPSEIKRIFGTIPPGGSGSIRRNVDLARVAGIEGEIEWQAHEQVTLGLTGLWSHTRFSESSEQPLLEGKPFPQAPELRLLANAEWRPVERLVLFAGGEYGGSQYDDALASREISDFSRFRIGVSWRSEHVLYQVRIENLLDAEIQTGLSSDGIRTLAGPRSVWLGVEWEF